MRKSHAEHKNDFLAFHRANPQVWRLLLRFAREAKQAGLKKISIALLVERVRWEEQVVTRSSDGYRINNNFRAFYSRKFERREEFKGMFEIRRQVSKKTVLRST